MKPQHEYDRVQLHQVKSETDLIDMTLTTYSNHSSALTGLWNHILRKREQKWMLQKRQYWHTTNACIHFVISYTNKIAYSMHDSVVFWMWCIARFIRARACWAKVRWQGDILSQSGLAKLTQSASNSLWVVCSHVIFEFECSRNKVKAVNQEGFGCCVSPTRPRTNEKNQTNIRYLANMSKENMNLIQD